MIERKIIELRGVVQGVGLRPYVARLARAHGLAGSVANHGDHVRVDVEGAPDAIARFALALGAHAPAGARFDEARVTAASPLNRQAFCIDESDTRGPVDLAVAPDRRTCAQCMAEVLDPLDRRAGYALTACVECGPRFTVVTGLPFDRARTTMATFARCERCEREYRDPEDRRSHAELVACPECGPTLTLTDRDGVTLARGTAAVDAAVVALTRGAVVAAQGLGGFQLLCDARDSRAIARIREKKHRPDRPMAVLVADLAMARELAWIDDEARALTSPEGPIVLLRKRAHPVCDAVAPRLRRVGVMLPTTAMHALLVRGLGAPLVCTSANARGEPVEIQTDSVRERMGAVAECVLSHDRAIAHRADDSVAMVIAGRTRVLRAGRGFAPGAFELGGDARARVCVGAHQKCAPVWADAGRAIALAHVGDLDTIAAREALAQAIDGARALFGRVESEVVCDQHPDYASTRWAEGAGPPVRRVFHHHAHVASVLAEQRWPSALGFAWDGSGLAPGPRMAGSEALFVDGAGARTVAHLRPFSLVGGDAAARDGLRSLAGVLAECGAVLEGPHSRYSALCEVPSVSPRTSSAGRLFDAVACWLGVRERSTYEAQAACELEAIADEGVRDIYPFALRECEIDWRPMVLSMLRDRADPARASAKFHNTLAAMIVAVCERERPERVALSGGCFANALLHERVAEALAERAITAASNERVPCGDGGIALGQAWVASRG